MNTIACNFNLFAQIYKGIVSAVRQFNLAIFMYNALF